MVEKIQKLWGDSAIKGMDEMVSLIIPCYNEQEALSLFYAEVKKVLNGFDCDYVTVMDADMQDPPDILPEMLKILKDGEYDSVATRRTSRQGEPIIRSWFARRFYQLINKISDTDIMDGARDFRLMKREMSEVIVEMGEYNRFSKGIFGWIGFRTYWLPYENTERIVGETKWNFRKLFKYAINGIINFSEVPLNLAFGFGAMMTFLAFLSFVFIVARGGCFENSTTISFLIISVMFFIGGIQLFCIGIMGQYLAKIYSESKHRPHYIIAETNKSDVKKIM